MTRGGAGPKNDSGGRYITTHTNEHDDYAALTDLMYNVVTYLG